MPSTFNNGYPASRLSKGWVKNLIAQPKTKMKQNRQKKNQLGEMIKLGSFLQGKLSNM